MKQKAFFSIIKRLSLKQMKKYFLEGENSVFPKNDTTKSIEDLTLKQKQQASILTLEIKGKYKADIPTLKKCNLCLNGKLGIIDNLNKRFPEQEVRSNLSHLSMSPLKQVLLLNLTSRIKHQITSYNK